jgi:hypothetical protein
MVAATIAAGCVFALLFYMMLTNPELPRASSSSGQQAIYITYEQYDNPDTAIPCQYIIITERDGDTYYTCPHTPDYRPASPILFHLPAPMYKKVLCTGTYGCAHRYNYMEIIPSDLLSQEHKQQLIDRVMSLPKVKENPEWRADTIYTHPQADKWIANVDLVLDKIRRPIGGECGWHGGNITVELETLQILGIDFNLPPDYAVRDEKCGSGIAENSGTNSTTGSS